MSEDYFSNELLSVEHKDSYYVPELSQSVEAGEYASARDIEIAALKKQAGKNNNAFMMGMKNLDEPVSPALFDGFLERKAKERGLPVKSSALEAVKGFGEGVVKAPARYAGHLATHLFPLIAKSAVSAYALSGAAGDAEPADKWVREMNKGIESFNNEMKRITGIDDASMIENLVVGSIADVSSGILLGGAAAPSFGLSAGMETYARQREKGVGMGESFSRALWHGIGEGALERLQLNRIMGSLAKRSRPIKMLIDVIENASQEGLQQANELAANWNIDDRGWVEKIQEVLVSMAGGAIASVAGSVGGVVLDKGTIKDVSDLMKKAGRSEQEIKAVTDSLNKIVDSDELQQAANQVAKDELVTVALTYKEQAQAASDALVVGLEDTIKRNELVDVGGALSGDKTEGMPPLYQLGDIQIDTTKNPNIGMVLYQAEQAGQPMQTLGQVLDWTKGKLNLEQARKMNTGINAVYNNTYQQLKAIGQDETLADANARVRSAMAYTLAKNYDMTPEQEDNMLGGIIQQRVSEFNGQGQEQYQDVAQRINEIDAEEKANGVPSTAPTININGVERQTTNSSGNPIAKSKKSLRYFYDWFGDSKVVDEQGRPLVVYHGTNADFNTFEKTKQKGGSYYGKGFYFSRWDDVSYYGDIKMPLYLKMTNPLIIDESSIESLKNVEDIVGEHPVMSDEDKLTDFEGWAKYTIGYRSESGGEIEQKVKSAGYDGVLVLDNENEGERNKYIVYDPNQIKSTSNRGTFSGSENIYYQFVGEKSGLIPQEKIDKANKMLKNKEHRDAIYKETGLWKGPDGFWRYEIDGSQASVKKEILNERYKNARIRKEMEENVNDRDKLREEAAKNPEKAENKRIRIEELEKEYEDLLNNAKVLSTVYLGDVFDFPELYNGYADLKDIAIEIEPTPPYPNWQGSYDPNTNTITLYSDTTSNATDNELKEILLHEIQHAIQDREGWATGGSSEYILSLLIKRMKALGEKEKVQQYSEVWEKVELYRDLATLFNLQEHPERVEKTMWYIENVFGGPSKKSKIWKQFISDRAQELQKAIIKKYENDPRRYDFNQERFSSKTYKEIKAEYNKLYAKLKRLTKDADIKERFILDGILSALKDPEELVTKHSLYERIYGEVEARNASERDMNVLLKEKAPYETQKADRKSINDDDTFVIMNGTLMPYRKGGVLYQDGKEGAARGAYYNNTIYLFENANESTFVHEMAHSYMDVLERLAQNGNTKAQSDLNVIRNWLGKKQGQAFTQADWERFARGFEMYMREGKSPNQYLGGEKGVFARFRDWLMHIYAGIKTLRVKNEKGKEEPVRINNQIRRFYDEMLGGTSIDEVFDTAEKNQQSLEVLDNKLKQLAEAQQKLAEEKAKLVRKMANNVKPDTTWANVKDWGKNVWESAKELPANVLQSSYERLAKIDPRLGLLVQRAEQAQGLRLKKWADEVQPFYEAFNKLSNDDKAKVQYFLLNQQWGDVEDILGKEGTEAVHGMLEEIYNELQDSGVEVGYRDNYFPRAVLDYDGLLQEMGLTYPSLRKEMEEAIGKDATPQEQAEWLDKHIMGFKGTVSTSGNRNTKERKLDLITDRMAQYYKPSMETLVDYMNGMAKLLSMREAFGKDIEYKDSTAEDSIGKIINRLFGDKKFTKKEIDEIRDVLSALYLPSGVGNKFLQAMRQYGYATKLSYSTTVRQFADIGMMMKVNGVLNTLDALFHPDKRITLENLGIDPLGEEFQTSKTDIGGRLANISTKWKGINWADAVMKNAFLRGKYKDLQNLAKTPEKFHEKYDSMFGDEVDTIIKDLNADKISEPVKVLLFHEISKIQPISRSSMPTAYLSNPNGRVFYMFKTFSLHRAEYMVGELADDFRRGDFKKAGKDIMADVAVIGWEGLVELLITFLKYGWQALAAEAVLETFAGSGLGVLGLNKHQALQLTRGQIGDFFQQMVGVGTPIDDIGYLIRHYDDDDKLLRAFLPDMIIEPLVAGPKELK